MSGDLQNPYRSLGYKLRVFREHANETVAEVSGAVEIDPEALQNIERGVERPSEDVLELLITHFAVEEAEAERLFKLAGYNKNQHEPKNDSQFTTVMVMPIDARIVYTDQVHIMANNYGVMMNFMQTAGPNNQPLAVARVGMSLEHAKSVLELLQQTLHQANKANLPKSLPQPRRQKDDNN